MGQASAESGQDGRGGAAAAAFHALRMFWVSTIKASLQQYRIWTSTTRRRAMADAYRPIVRGFLLPGAAYYIFVTWGHWRDETGTNFLILASISALTVIAYGLFRWVMLPAGRTPLRRLEAVGLATNALMYANVVAYMSLHFEEQKLIYFVLMAVVFSTTGVTLRATLASVILSIGTMFWFAGNAAPEIARQFALSVSRHPSPPSAWPHCCARRSCARSTPASCRPTGGARQPDGHRQSEVDIFQDRRSRRGKIAILDRHPGSRRLQVDQRPLRSCAVGDMCFARSSGAWSGASCRASRSAVSVATSLPS